MSSFPAPNSIFDLGASALDAQMALWRQPKFRAGQIWQWLYVHMVSDWDEMTNLPKSLREQLAHVYTLGPLAPIGEQISSDGQTEKTLFRLVDGATIESVLMHYEGRNTVCVSTQVGCPIGCTFCATGQSGFERNLTAGEIIAQPLYFASRLRAQAQSVSHIVVMGMGEPLINYDATWQAVGTWNDQRGFNVGARRITLSTAGYIPGIERLAEESLQVGLAVSLHAPTDALRSDLVPLNKTYPLADLLKACQAYIARTGRRITFEYALIDGINDSPAQARHLAALLNRLLCHINLIPLNPSSGSNLRPSSSGRVSEFQRILEENGIAVTVRLRRGIDIQAGCGQLRQQSKQDHP
ncbi:MAG: 23S rRNA (adenine(2503)-C(2))-methyltransferase RlmN [Anaerolineae bacterium]|nr:23S rRNA (adenine(2503)-C(2))-methyltransferase RlmN [Anaerolineae bacterium]